MLRKISEVEKLFLGVIFSGLVIVISYQIIIRWLGMHSLSWVEELCQHLWVCTTMLAVSIGTTEDGMMKVSALENALPQKASKLLIAAINLFCGAISAYFAFQAYKAGEVLYKICLLYTSTISSRWASFRLSDRASAVRSRMSRPGVRSPRRT